MMQHDAVRSLGPSAASAIAALLIAGIFFLKAPVVLITGVALAFFVTCLVLCVQPRVDRLALLLLANFAYWISSGLFVGGFELGDLATNDFFDSDGRIFIYYLPLLIFCIVPSRESDLRMFVLACKVLAVLSVLAFFVWQVTHAPLISGPGGQLFYGFLTSHTGAGSFFGALSTLLIVYGLASSDRSAQLLGFATLLPLMGSGSRAGLVALCLATVWYLVRSEQWRVFPGNAIVLAILLGAAALVSPEAVGRSAELFSWELFDTARTLVADASWEPGDERLVSGPWYNVLSRILFWMYALRLFALSPFVGVGFARFGDAGLDLQGVPGVVMLAFGGDKSLAGDPAVDQAHNSYLHLLAESGLIGLVLLATLWIVIYRRLRQSEQAGNGPRERAYAIACQGLVLYVLATALFGHGLAAPSVGVPVLAAVGLALAYRPRPTGVHVPASG